MDIVPARLSTATDSKINADCVMLYILALVVFVIILEAFLHHLHHIVKKHHKYAEMLHKTTSELMVVGLIYMLVKFMVFVGWVDYGKDAYQGMDAADAFIFCMAIALVVQSLVIFTRLRTSNKAMDEISIISAKDLLNQAKKSIRESKSELAGFISRQKARDSLQVRVLGQCFNSAFNLPKLFSFTKYIREVQDSQIAHLLDVDITIWIVLLGVYAAFFVAAGDFQTKATKRFLGNSALASPGDYDVADDHRYQYFAIFSVSLVLAKVILLFYLRSTVTRLIKHADTFLTRKVLGNRPNTRLVSHDDDDDALFFAMETVAEVELQLPIFPIEESIDQMRQISEQLTEHSHNSHHSIWHSLIGPSLFAKLIGSCFRKMSGQKRIKNHALKTKLNDSGVSLNLPLFSRKTSHFFVQLLIIVNGFYYSLLINAVLHVKDGNSGDATTNLWSGLCLFVPLFMNSIVLAPKIIRAYALIDATWHVDAKKLAKVIEHFADVETMKQQMIREINTYLMAHNQTPEDIRLALVSADADSNDNDDGYIHIDVLRNVLKTFGFKFGRHKFHTFVRVEFQTKGATILYNDFLRLLTDTPSRFE
jgi:hypothetical protein